MSKINELKRIKIVNKWMTVMEKTMDRVEGMEKGKEKKQALMFMQMLYQMFDDYNSLIEGND